MTRLFHYMLPKIYHELIEKRVLMPRSTIFHPDVNRQYNLEADMEEKWLFCFLNSTAPKEWVESGWLDRLRKMYKWKYAVVSFAPENDAAFVLEAGGVYNLLTGLGITRQLALEPKKAQKTIESNFGILGEAFIRYKNSKTPLKSYDGSFIIPEVIYKKPVKLENLMIESKVF